MASADTAGIAIASPARASQNGGQRRRIPEQPRRLGLQLRATVRRNPVIARFSIVLGDTPLRVDVASLFQPVERLVQRRVLDLERARRLLLQPARDLEAVHWRPGKSL